MTNSETGTPDIPALRRRLIEAARELLAASANRPFSATLMDGEPLVVVAGAHDEVAALLSRVLSSHTDEDPG